MMQILARIVGRVGETFAADRHVVEQVLALADKQQDLATRQLAARYRELYAAVTNGTPWNNHQILVPLLATVATAIRRVLGFPPYSVQVLAALALARGEIAEMQTGEGKTLATAFPAVLFSLAGSGVHVMTVNAYLAERDHQILSPISWFAGSQSRTVAAQRRPGGSASGLLLPHHLWSGI
jgi:preprotein translocase subunit SecA